MVDPREEAYHVIVKVLKKGVFSSNLLDKAGRKLEKAGADHNLFYTLVKGVIKMQRNLDWVAAAYAADRDKYEATNLKIRILLFMALYQLRHCDHIPDHAALHETVEMAKRLYNKGVADWVNGMARSVQRDPDRVAYPDDPVRRLALEHSFPDDMVRSWMDEWGEDETEMLCMYFNDVPRLNIRANLLATTPRRLSAYFARREVKLEHSGVSPNMLFTRQPRQVLRDVAHQEGYFSIQDPSAALIVELLQPHPGHSVLDLFAGPGGKCTYIAELMDNEGEVIAVDKIPNKVKKLKQAAHRLQIGIIQTVTEDCFRYGPVAPAYDRVLLDVPCSGWGVLQKKAELRWQAAQDMGELQKLQEAAIEHGARFVKSGGLLVYSTCTVNRAENEDRVRNFLGRHSEYSLVDAATVAPSEFTSEGFLKTIPHRHHVDGAFAALLLRK
ncbi:MAG: 16S rRNA (cytosine(967)-C(5))-methyltransferase RsmB [Candidatus Cloacimonetes bacterium]|nr:16S rRNA (cytosine(967)-C(5))-methyltransferase RsmB [Candidatus Cloacimonadota bacterium]